MKSINDELKHFIKVFCNDGDLQIKEFKIVKNGIELIYTRENINGKFYLNKE